MPKPKLNPAREEQIDMEIVVDGYGEEERAMGWYYYLKGKLEFPFNVRCVVSRTISPLKKGEEAEVVSMPREDDCMREMFVLIRSVGRKLGVPVSQLDVLEAGHEIREAVENWRYWVAKGHDERLYGESRWPICDVGFVD